jgi:hypothetical protein
MSAFATARDSVTRVAPCEKHNLEYGQILFPRTEGQPEFWTGGCPICDEDARREARVTELVSKRLGEKLKRVEQRVAERAGEIEASIDRAMGEEREERRAEWRAQFEETVREEAEIEVDRQMRAKILEDLKQKER